MCVFFSASWHTSSAVHLQANVRRLRVQDSQPVQCIPRIADISFSTLESSSPFLREWGKREEEREEEEAVDFSELPRSMLMVKAVVVVVVNHRREGQALSSTSTHTVDQKKTMRRQHPLNTIEQCCCWHCHR